MDTHRDGDAPKVRYWGRVRGRYVQITKAESDARYFAPLDGVYNDSFRHRRYQHQERIWAQFDGTRPGELGDASGDG